MKKIQQNKKKQGSYFVERNQNFGNDREKKVLVDLSSAIMKKARYKLEAFF